MQSPHVSRSAVPGLIRKYVNGLTVLLCFQSSKRSYTVWGQYTVFFSQSTLKIFLREQWVD